MEKVKTATGKQFDCDYFNPSQQTRQCNIQIYNQPIGSIATVFSNPMETVQLWCGGNYASGYTRLVAIVPEGNAVRVVLGKE